MAERPTKAEPNQVAVGPLDITRITKMFGPTWAADIRVWMDFDSDEWVIERQVTHDQEHVGVADVWELVARTPFCTDEDEAALKTYR